MLFEIYAMICLMSKIYLEKRYDKKYYHFSFYISFYLNSPKFLSYPFQVILRKKYDKKYYHLYLCEKIKGDRWIQPTAEEMIELKKELNKIERKIKLKKLK